MNISRDDIRRLRPSLLLAATMIALGASAITWSRQMLSLAEAENQAMTLQQRDLERRLAQARAEAQEIHHKFDRYRALQQRGIIGEEKRLEWLGLIRKIQLDRRLPELRYEIAPQRPLDPSILPGARGDNDFRASAMELQMGLVHEEDLLCFLDDLAASAPAHIRTRGCTIERTAVDLLDLNSLPPNTPTLRAECSIDWITIRPKGNNG